MKLERKHVGLFNIVNSHGEPVAQASLMKRNDRREFWRLERTNGQPLSYSCDPSPQACARHYCQAYAMTGV